MEVSTRASAAEAAKVDCVAVGVFAGGELTAAARRIDSASKGALRAAIKSGDATGARGTTLLLRSLAGVTAPRVLLVGLGKADEFSDRAFTEAVRASCKAAGSGSRELAIAAGDWKTKGATPSGAAASWRSPRARPCSAPTN